MSKSTRNNGVIMNTRTNQKLRDETLIKKRSSLPTDNINPKVADVMRRLIAEFEARKKPPKTKI